MEFLDGISGWPYGASTFLGWKMWMEFLDGKAWLVEGEGRAKRREHDLENVVAGKKQIPPMGSVMTFCH